MSLAIYALRGLQRFIEERSMHRFDNISRRRMLEMAAAGGLALTGTRSPWAQRGVIQRQEETAPPLPGP